MVRLTPGALNRPATLVFYLNRATHALPRSGFVLPPERPLDVAAHASEPPHTTANLGDATAIANRTMIGPW